MELIIPTTKLSTNAGEFEGRRHQTDPTDEQLAELMLQAAEDARHEWRIANDKFFDELHKACEDAKQRSKSNGQ